MARILVLSNGHGEDLSGALLAQDLQQQGHSVQALPLAGLGSAYSKADVPLLGRSHEFSTGGIGYTSFQGRLTELLQGQVLYLLRRLIRLLRHRQRFDLILVVGDVIPVIAAWLSHRPVATYLVAYSSHYEGQLRLPWPCAALLKSKRFKAVYSRDQRTAEDLSHQLHRPVTFLGNPFMDSVLTGAATATASGQRIGLLPGSRRPELEQNLQLLLQLMELLPTTPPCNVDLALVPSLNDVSLQRLSNRVGWRLTNGVLHRDGSVSINVRRGAFNAVLQNSDLMIGMAGTAIEQAVGLAKPVLQVSGQGPQFTAAFAEAQRRLLGPTVFCAPGESGSREALKATAELALALLDRFRRDPGFQQQCRVEAKRRLGEAGGGPRMAAAISALLP
uniref:lipid-A-disaccharide synthase-related protein n=1 Tax=Synechococcus sp. UW106 TaxID=368495 RepID=UPI000E0F2C54|nr:lipid-A-disaccharide synthase-related protein [Synechococcus sp. UW106]